MYNIIFLEILSHEVMDATWAKVFSTGSFKLSIKSLTAFIGDNKKKKKQDK